MNILKKQNSFINKSYLTVSVLGINYKLNIKYTKKSSIDLVQGNNDFTLFLPMFYKNAESLDIVNSTIQKLYEKVASTEIEYSMELARHIYKFAPDDYKIERFNGYYKVSKHKIIINPDIVQFNKEIINTTILQAFCQVKYKINTPKYLNALNSALSDYEQYKRTNNSKNKLIKMVS